MAKLKEIVVKSLVFDILAKIYNMGQGLGHLVLVLLN